MNTINYWSILFASKPNRDTTDALFDFIVSTQDNKEYESILDLLVTEFNIISYTDYDDWWDKKHETNDLKEPFFTLINGYEFNDEFLSKLEDYLEENQYEAMEE